MRVPTHLISGAASELTAICVLTLGKFPQLRFWELDHHGITSPVRQKVPVGPDAATVR
jgi:hypothetical protein